MGEFLGHSEGQGTLVFDSFDSRLTDSTSTLRAFALCVTEALDADPLDAAL
jgi:hypothetical protein